jgi:hypothetical protein
VTVPRHTRLAPAIISVIAMVALSSCTGDDPDDSPSPTGSGTSSVSPSPTAAGTDQSALVLAAQLPPVVGTAKGDIAGAPATLNVAGVVAAAGGTVLTFWHTGTDKLLVNAGDLSWEAQPTLVDPASKKVYEPVTFVDDMGDTRCLCTDAAYIRGVPQPRTIYFPDLPESVTSIEVSQAGFGTGISVPVTR